MTNDEIFAAMQAHADSIPEPPSGPIPRRERPLDKTSMSYWFPLVEAAGLPVPKTKFVDMTDTCRRKIWDLFDGKDFPNDVPEPFFDQLTKAADEMKYPCFLRTTHTSDKHSWKRTCFLREASSIPAHVFSLAEFSECCDMFGMPWDTWVVREFLPIIPFGHCPNYGDMPVNREFRFFVQDGEYKCHHPYWPISSLEQGGWEVDADQDTAYSELCALTEEELEHLKTIAISAGIACGGAWSVDLLETERGWFLTDMAEAHKSFHWEGCKANEKQRLDIHR